MVATLYFGNVLFEVVKGNGLQDTVLEDHTAGKFQPNMYDAVNRNLAVRLVEQIALLGSRGDTLNIELHVKTSSSAGNDVLTESVLIEGVEYTSVLPDVQMGVFGIDSPFATASPGVRDSMLIGVDKQEVNFTNNVEIASPTAQSTPESQKLRGVVDSRITFFGDTAVANTCTKWTLQLKPGFDTVFLLRAGCLIWLRPGLADKA